MESSIEDFERGNLSYDVVVIGAGLSGLRAAYDLKDYNILVLEKENRAGGRVFSRKRNGISYDLGAVLAYDKNLLPFEFVSSELIYETGRIGILSTGRIHYGGSVTECLHKLDLDPQNLRTIDRLAPRRLPDEIYKVLNCLFRQIHFGDMREYLVQRQKDALMTFGTHHFAAGNGEIIGQFVQRLSRCLSFDAEALAVTEEEGHACVTLRRRHKETSVLAKAVILATPAPAALKVLRTKSELSRSFLVSLRHGEGTVVAIGFRGAPFRDLSYLVTPGLATNTILIHNSKDRRAQVALVYYAAEQSARLKMVDETRIVEQTVAIIRQLNIGRFLNKDILFSDVCRWPLVGPVISQASYSNWDKRVMRPSDRVFLTGDYLYADPADLLPYGMRAALASGKQTAQSVREFLR